LEIDHERGVMYFHSEKGNTIVRISALPAPIPGVRDNLMDSYDIEHMNGVSCTVPKKLEDTKVG
jgi:hypothetical protein